MKEKVKEILKDLDFLENPYLQSLHDGTLTLEDFVETQIQFFYAVDFFSRPMAMLAAKIPTASMRLEIIRNVWEEHGEGNLEKAHTKTFLDFLNRLANVTFDDVYKRSLWPEVRIFNSAITAVCTLDDYMTGIGAMGMIEYMFSDISSKIGKGILKRGWMDEKTILHYNTHEVLDIRHADDFFKIVEKAYAENKEHQYYIEQGLWFGATLFYMLYQQLYTNRERRSLRDVSIPHSRAEGIPC
ncbi:MAG: iron-containing redox enzyme family protein [Proteobacteria bacterium]|nr:iron-containing redox enzyme family protein [Pseudomonadota bacterium]